MPKRLLLLAMFVAPFLILAASYPTLPPEIPILRLPIATRFAAKSLFTVFRVPLMNLTHGLLAAIFLHRATDFAISQRRRAYSAIFSTLLFAIALKTNFEAIELSLPHSRWFAIGTFTSVVAGLAIAFIRGREVPLPWTELRLTLRDRILITGCVATYLIVVTLSLLISHARA